MDIQLTPALVHFIDARFATGRYESKSEVIREALRLLELHYAAAGNAKLDLTDAAAGAPVPRVGASAAVRAPQADAEPKPITRPAPAPGPVFEETSINDQVPQHLIDEAERQRAAALASRAAAQPVARPAQQQQPAASPPQPTYASGQAAAAPQAPYRPQAPAAGQPVERNMITDPAQPVGENTMQAILSRIEDRIDRNAAARQHPPG